MSMCFRLVSAFALVAAGTFVPAQESGKADVAADSLSDASRVEYLPKPSPAEQKILAALEKISPASFADVPLLEAVTFLKEQHDIDIVVDYAALKQAQVLPDVAIQLDVKGTRLKSVLNLMCKGYNLAWVVEDDVLKITSPLTADAHYFTRTYPVRDLCPKPEDLKTLRGAVEKGVAGAVWETQGGQGSVSDVGSAHSLVVTQTWKGHQQVLELLRMLRDARALGGEVPKSE